MENQKIVEKVRRDLSSRDAVIKELYTNEKLRSSVRSYLLKNSGQENDLGDLMSYGVMSFIKQCYRPLFELKKPVEAYVFSIIKYEWMRMKKTKMVIVEEEARPELASDYNILDSMIGTERMEALKAAMKNLDAKCRKVLTHWASNIKMREIALKMNYKSEGMARKKKHECLGKLKQLTINI